MSQLQLRYVELCERGQAVRKQKENLRKSEEEFSTALVELQAQCPHDVILDSGTERLCLFCLCSPKESTHKFSISVPKAVISKVLGRRRQQLIALPSELIEILRKAEQTIQMVRELQPNEPAEEPIDTVDQNA